MSDDLVKGSGSHDYERILLCLAYKLQGYPLFSGLMYTNIGKLIYYRRRLSTIRGVCLEGFHCNIATCSVIILITIELLNYIIKNHRSTQGKNYNCDWLWENLSVTCRQT